MSNCIVRKQTRQIERLRRQFAQADGLAFAEVLSLERVETTLREERVYDWLLVAIASHQVNDRPDRVEPRARKRRPKQYPRLMQPRRLAQTQLGVNC